MTSAMEKDPCNGGMEPRIPVSSLKMSSMAMELTRGPINANTLVLGTWESAQAMARAHIPTEASTKEISRTISKKAEVSSPSRMVAHTSEIGVTI